MTFTIDTFKDSDKQDWLELWDMNDPWSKENARPDIPESNWKNLMNKQGSLLGLALRSKAKMVGYILYFFCPSLTTPKDECQIRSIFIHPDFRRQAGGTMLMNKIFDLAEKKDIGRIYWFCNPARKDSLAFAQQFGGGEGSQQQAFYSWLDSTHAKAA